MEKNISFTVNKLLERVFVLSDRGKKSNAIHSRPRKGKGGVTYSSSNWIDSGRYEKLKKVDSFQE